MSKNQKLDAKPKTKKSEKAKTEQVNGCCSECQCDKTLPSFDCGMPEYDELREENKQLKKILEDIDRDILYLSRVIENKDETILALQGNVDFYRNRGVWATIKYKWFRGC